MSNRMTHMALAVLLAVAAPTVAGAANDLTLDANGTLHEAGRSHTVTTQAVIPTATAPTAQVAGRYVYQARTVRDPFVPPIQARASKELDGADLPVLQRYGLADFKLIGIIKIRGKRAAMVSTPDGKGYTVKVGTRLGPNQGKIRRITNDTVTIESIHTDVFGEPKKSETVLALRPEEVIP